MGVACSSTWFLIVTLLAWALVALLAALAAPRMTGLEEHGEPPARAPRKAPRRFIVGRAPRGSSLHPHAFSPARGAIGSVAPPP